MQQKMIVVVILKTPHPTSAQSTCLLIIKIMFPFLFWRSPTLQKFKAFSNKNRKGNEDITNKYNISTTKHESYSLKSESINNIILLEKKILLEANGNIRNFETGRLIWRCLRTDQRNTGGWNGHSFVLLPPSPFSFIYCKKDNWRIRRELNL